MFAVKWFWGHIVEIFSSILNEPKRLLLKQKQQLQSEIQVGSMRLAKPPIKGSNDL